MKVKVNSRKYLILFILFLFLGNVPLILGISPSPISFISGFMVALGFMFGWKWTESK